MSPDNRVLVVGTTPDYVDWIDRHCPGRGLFLTDPILRQNAGETAPEACSELLADLTGAENVWRKLTEHLDRWAIRLAGIACFDDESMVLAAILADRLDLPYPSGQAIGRCRDKFRCKQFWGAAGVPTARSSEVVSPQDAGLFLSESPGACVLKPLTGAGSELVFLCRSQREVMDAVGTIGQGLHRQRENRLYAGADSSILAEEFIPGPEFSCDFLIEDCGITIVRLARKILLSDGPLGTVLGYLAPASLPQSLLLSDLACILERAAQCLGLSRAICMADFIIPDEGEPILLELAPRPGGDCLPHLLRHAAGFDMLELTLDFAECKPISIPPGGGWEQMVGLRIHARREGVVEAIDSRQAREDHRVREVHIARRVGHHVVLPPGDYSSWLLGHIIFRPTPGLEVEAQCGEILDGVKITIEGSP